MTQPQPPDSDDLLFLAEDDGAAEAEPAAEPWVVMIVDDDEDVHQITRAVIDDIRFMGRGIRVVDCHSGAAARAALDAGLEVAVILLDVVMETDDAGLQLVRHVREELQNQRVRIVLRTGQPGQAPERDVIIRFDINDYKTKTELTAQKLFTTLIAALRSYQDLVTLQASRDGLRRIGDASTELFQVREPEPFVERVLDELIGFVRGDARARSSAAIPPTPRKAAACGRWRCAAGIPSRKWRCSTRSRTSPTGGRAGSSAAAPCCGC